MSRFTPVRMRVEMFDKNGKMIQSTTLTRKIAFRRFVQVNSNSESKFKWGLCRVTYNRSKNYYNEFNFDSYDDFVEKFNPCVEEALIKEFV